MSAPAIFAVKAYKSRDIVKAYKTRDIVKVYKPRDITPQAATVFENRIVCFDRMPPYRPFL